MNIAASIIVALCLIFGSRAIQAQVPYVLGTWKLNVEASKLPGPAPQTQVRSYRLADDGVLIGIAVTIDAQGRPTFLQFAGKVDGRGHPEFSNDSAAKYLTDGTLPPRTYAEISTNDPRKVQWVDTMAGKPLFSGEKWVSNDGKQLSFTLDTKNEQGKSVQFLYVFDRTGT